MADGYKYLQDIDVNTEHGVETLELWRNPGGGLFAVDATFLDQVGEEVFDPFEGNKVTLEQEENNGQRESTEGT